MAVGGQDIASIIRRQIQEFGSTVEAVDVGTVIQIGDGVANIHGLAGVRYGELIEFGTGAIGMALNLEEESVGAVIMGSEAGIQEGTEVRTTGRIAQVPAGDALLGRVVDALGAPIDGKGPIQTTKMRDIEKLAPDVASRSAVNRPVQTGIKAVDSMVPIGRGQRELIIGDRSTGKSAIALDTIINQKGGDLICIYVAIGQKASKVAQTVGMLEENGAMEHTVVVAANASDPAAMQYLSVYTGCAIAEEFMEQGKDALIVYDDLTKHAWAYRQISLLLRRPPGREAYPGDVFYLHSRLLERAASLSEELGGGTLTALPIIETQAGDVSAYIPTNVISITDGQIYLETELFNAGTRPAVNAGLSVSRVGSAAQTRAIRKVAGTLRLDLAQYRNLQAFAQFGSDDLDASTRRQLERGRILSELLKQGQYEPIPFEKEAIILFAGSQGLMDDVPIEKVNDFETALYLFMDNNYAQIGEAIRSEADISDETSEALTKAINEFKEGGAY
ncbi:MAG: F0F1 ATP synthase subunit alpha [Dehalococcoidia bacterium]